MKLLGLPQLLARALGFPKEQRAPVPHTGWDLFESRDARAVELPIQQRMEGVYGVEEGAAFLGPEAVLQWTWTREGGHTAYHVSIFGEREVAVLTGEGRMLDGGLLLNMWWRTLANTGRGTCHLRVRGEGVEPLNGSAPIATAGLRIEGVYGKEGDPPEQRIVLVYRRPLAPLNGFQVLAHRGGGRNGELLPASENSLELILLAARLGATGVELDVQFTSDGVPVVYHDGTLNARCIRPCGLSGAIEKYTHAQLSRQVRLIGGECIPTLREALDAVVDRTPLDLVWLDMKWTGPLDLVREMQREYIAKGRASGREVRILIGLPEEQQLARFQELPDHAMAPSLCEMDPQHVRAVNAQVWAPSWTRQTSDAELADLHQEGRQAFVWTVDDAEHMRACMRPGGFDGILSNYPSLVAYHAHRFR